MCAGDDKTVREISVLQPTPKLFGGSDRERGIMEFPVERQARSGLISERFVAPHALLPVEEGLPAASLRDTVVRELDRESWKAHNLVW